MSQVPGNEYISQDRLPQPNSSTPAPNCLRKVAWRLVPFLCLLYIFNILDRTNLGFARLTMEPDLGMSPEVFDLGFGIFYVGYLLFEVPANLLLRRIGARRWMARILITWGLVSIAMMAVTGWVSFYLVRILLGFAEAGFFPGIILYLTYWFPARERARIMAYFIMAIPLAGIFGQPLSGAILQYLHGLGDLNGWQWLFLVEGIPSVILGLVVLAYLPDGPEQARWLTAEERTWLQAQLAVEEHPRRQRHSGVLVGALVDWRVWLLIGVYFTVAMGANAAGSYFPKLIKNHFPGRDPFEIGLLGAIPHISAIVGMALLAWNSDRTGERRGHVSLAAHIAAAGWIISAWAPTPELFLIGLCLAQTGMMSMLPLFWTLPTAYLSAAAAAGGIALINSVANLGGLVGSNILGWFGPASMAGMLFVGGILALCVRQEATRIQGKT